PERMPVPPALQVREGHLQDDDAVVRHPRAGPAGPTSLLAGFLRPGGIAADLDGRSPGLWPSGPSTQNDGTVIRVQGLRKYFELRPGFFKALRGNILYVKAVDGVDFPLRQGEILGLVGRSGFG